MYKRLGEILRREREYYQLTQEGLAKHVKLSSKFISLIESGKSMPSIESLRKIADFFKKDIAYFLKNTEKEFDIFLKGKKSNERARSEIKKFRKYCEDYLKLEELSGRHLVPGPVYRSVSPEEMAREERQRLGLGSEPIRDIFMLLELNGLRILRQSIYPEAEIAGLFVYYKAKQASFALVNHANSLGEQAVIASHEYCHYLRDREGGPILDNPDIFVDEYISLYHPREKFAQRFALHFLIPESKLKQVLNKYVVGGKVRYEDIIVIKRYFGVSMAIMLKKLLEMKLIPLKAYKEYQGIDCISFEKSLYGDLIGDSQQSKRKRKTVTSDRYKSLGVTLSATRE
jgi:Zn-dependent peptidase ImmA (M78 family)/plasmid maintenance system antidote protein VapI